VTLKWATAFYFLKSQALFAYRFSEKGLGSLGMQDKMSKKSNIGYLDKIFYI
jgi:hypothetical protein